MHCIKFDLYPLIERKSEYFFNESCPEFLQFLIVSKHLTTKRKIFSSGCEKEETQSIPVSVDDIHLSMHLLCMDHLDMCPVDFDDHVDISVEIASIVLCCHASGSLLNCLRDIFKYKLSV
ncbi:hypothetical protein T07_829 [Trichinella nelsoni]|uniref:Uncharacterized protein n=1 Tax=Trichinella nelsoni TaxID=6336 RepID=A0A0V0RQD4_9BILA|nr:hypothetical protein T07_829 [Trichinella nelsoni]